MATSLPVTTCHAWGRAHRLGQDRAGGSSIYTEFSFPTCHVKGDRGSASTMVRGQVGAGAGSSWGLFVVARPLFRETGRGWESVCALRSLGRAGSGPPTFLPALCTLVPMVLATAFWASWGHPEQGSQNLCLFCYPCLYWPPLRCLSY